MIRKASKGYPTDDCSLSSPLQGTSGQQTLTAKLRLSRQSLLLCICERLPSRRYTNRAAFEFGNFHLMSPVFADDFKHALHAQRFSRPAPGLRGSGHRPPGWNVHAKRLFVKVRVALRSQGCLKQQSRCTTLLGEAHRPTYKSLNYSVVLRYPPGR